MRPIRHDGSGTWWFRHAMLLVLLVTACATVARAEEPQPPAPSVVTSERAPAGEEAPLVVWNRTITTFRATLGNLSPRERARRSAERILALPERLAEPEIRASPTKVGHAEGILIEVDARVVFGLTQEDLDPESKETLDQAVQTACSNLRAFVLARTHQNRGGILLRGAMLSAVALLVFVVFLVLLYVFDRGVRKRLTTLAGEPGTRRLTLRQELRRQLLFAVQGLIRIACALVALVAVYGAVTYILHQFPYTEPLGLQFTQYMRSTLVLFGQNFIESLPGLFTVLIILMLARVFIRTLATIFDQVEKGRLDLPGFDSDTVFATRRIVNLVIWAFALVVAYPYIPGSGTDAFKGVSVFLGLMMTLGSAGLISQIMSGMVVIYSRALKPGELVHIGETQGVVSKVGIMSTKIVTFRREEVTIPNSLLIGHATVNFSRLAGKNGPLFTTAVTIGYDTPWRQVHALLEKAADRTAGIRRDPAPRIIQKGLSDFYVEYVLMFHLEQDTQPPAVLSQLHGQIQDAFNEFGVQIMSPHFKDQPEKPVIVPKEQWHAEPARPDGT